MLIRFSVGNYRSFKDIQEISMTSGRTEGHPDHLNDRGPVPVLRAAAVYGANASGKSNLIKALRAVKDYVVVDRKMPTDQYYRPDDCMRDEPSYFEVELEIGGSIYSYGFEYIISRQEIVDEWLHRLFIDKDSEALFQRTGRNIAHSFKDQDKQKLDVYAEDTIEHGDRLFLNVMGRRARPAEGDLGIFNDVYEWFRDHLRFIDTDYPFTPEVPVSESDFERLNKIISSFGTGINSIGYTRKEGMDETLPQRLIDDLRKDLGRGKGSGKLCIECDRYASVNNYRVSLEGDRVVFDEIVYRHNDDRVVYRPDEESDGTRRLYGLLASTFVGEGDDTFVIDELDTSLHPQMTFRFVGMFLEGGLSGGSQILFSTHESSLMDFQLLRRDEIWFIEKGRDGDSRIYSLEDFNERNDRRIEKAYREGRYGGVPVFSAVFPTGRER